MKIETEYEINQPVWTVKYNKIIECYIKSITARQNGKGHANNGVITVEYGLQSIDGNLVSEYIATHKIHSTKQEAANAWLIEQGLTIGLTED